MLRQMNLSSTEIGRQAERDVLNSCSALQGYRLTYRRPFFKNELKLEAVKEKSLSIFHFDDSTDEGRDKTSLSA